MQWSMFGGTAHVHVYLVYQEMRRAKEDKIIFTRALWGFLDYFSFVSGTCLYWTGVAEEEVNAKKFLFVVLLEAFTYGVLRTTDRY